MANGERPASKKSNQHQGRGSLPKLFTRFFDSIGSVPLSAGSTLDLSSQVFRISAAAT